jgi:hypothetical protein
MVLAWRGAARLPPMQFFNTRPPRTIAHAASFGAAEGDPPVQAAGGWLR